jgi:hypothetical protein
MCGKKSLLETQLEPITVASVIHFNGEMKSKYFTLRDSLNFVEEWIEYMFKEAEYFTEKKEDKLVNVLGYNSSKFDFIFILPFLVNDKWKIVSNAFIGTATKAKQTVIKHNTTNVQLRFLDLLLYAPVGDLKSFVKAFNPEEKPDNKGIFPYDVCDISISVEIGSKDYLKEVQKQLNNILDNNNIFTKKQFYNSLKQVDISDSDYEIYKNIYQNYHSRWDYLISYNVRDCEIMIKPINNLLRMWEEYGIDMFHELPPSGNASVVKHK